MAGVGMLEVLVALLVLSIGVLGVAQLQGLSTRQNHDAYLRSQATFLAFSIADRMRSNQEQASDYVIGMTDSVSSPDNQAEQDLSYWLATIARQLPDGHGAIVDNTGTYTITVQYSIAEQYDDGDANDNARDIMQVSVETEVAR